MYILYSNDCPNCKILENKLKNKNVNFKKESNLDYIIKNRYNTPFDFFEDYLEYWEGEKHHTISHSRNSLYEILFKFYKERSFKDLNILNEIIKYDYIYNNKNPNIPRFLERTDVSFIQRNKHDILKNENLLNGCLIKHKNKPTKQIINKIHIEAFKIDIIELIENDYKLENGMIQKTYILFDYKDSPIDRSVSYNITECISKE